MAERILLIDDDMDTLRLVGLMLQRQGYQILAANNGPQALVIAEKELPDLILLDVMMPEMDGYEVARRLRANPSTNNIPIIMFTAKSQVDDKIQGFKAGADVYLTKPTQPRELFAQMKAVLSRATKIGTTGDFQSIDKKERGIIYGIMGAKGGMGVSTFALNLAISLKKNFDKELILADFRPGQGTIGLDLGYTKAEGLNRLLQRKLSEISQLAVEGELFNHPTGIRLLLSSHRPSDSKNSGKPDHFEIIAGHLARISKYVLLDMPPSLCPDNEKVIKLCDRLIILVESTVQSITMTRLLIQDLTSQDIAESLLIFTLLNRVRSDTALSKNQVQEKLGYPISAVFTPAPELAYQAATNNKPMIMQQPESLTTQQFAEFAKFLTQT